MEKFWEVEEVVFVDMLDAKTMKICKDQKRSGTHTNRHNYHVGSIIGD